MAKFEVHIPAGNTGGFNTTLKVDADNWMAALKAGLSKLGEQGALVQNVMVDIQEDNSVHVTESRSGRVFRIRELSEAEAAAAPVKKGSGVKASAATAANAAATIRMDVPEFLKSQAKPSAAEAPTQPPTPSPAEAATAPMPPAAAKHHAHPKKKHKSDADEVVELEHPTMPIKGAIGRDKSKGKAKGEPEIEDVLADIFMTIQDINSKTSPEEAMEFVLSLALEKVPSDAGSVLHADSGTGDLTFFAAHGPAAKELLRSKIVIPQGSGIAGFCTTEGVSVAVSDVQKDPRFYSEVADKVDYETKSLCCAPMMARGRTFGCIQLINKKSGATFAEWELGVLSYLANQAAVYLNDRA